MEIGGAGALARHHRGAQWVPRSAFLAEGLTLVRFDESLQHLAAAAPVGLRRFDGVNREPYLCVKVAVLLRQSPSAPRYLADPSPMAIARLEHILDQSLGGKVSLIADDALVGVLKKSLTGFELNDDAPNTVEDIECLKPGDHDWHPVGLDQRLVLPGAHDRTDVSSGEKPVDTIGR